MYFTFLDNGMLLQVKSECSENSKKFNTLIPDWMPLVLPNDVAIDKSFKFCHCHLFERLVAEFNKLNTFSVNIPPSPFIYNFDTHIAQGLKYKYLTLCFIFKVKQKSDKSQLVKKE